MLLDTSPCHGSLDVTQSPQLSPHLSPQTPLTPTEEGRSSDLGSIGKEIMRLAREKGQSKLSKRLCDNQAGR